jgi:hypothetical protein
MQSFNQLLIIRIQLYFKKKYGLSISDETANEYLDSLGGVFAVFAESEGGLAPPELLKEEGGAAHPASRLDNLLT